MHQVLDQQRAQRMPQLHPYSGHQWIGQLLQTERRSFQSFIGSDRARKRTRNPMSNSQNRTALLLLVMQGINLFRLYCTLITT